MLALDNRGNITAGTSTYREKIEDTRVDLAGSVLKIFPPVMMKESWRLTIPGSGAAAAFGRKLYLPRPRRLRLALLSSIRTLSEPSLR